jgi:hypothetical protein
MTAAAEVFEQTRHDDTLEQNFAILLTELAVALRDLVASVNEQSFFVFESIQIDIFIRFYVHESFCEHLKKNFDRFDARFEMIDTFFQNDRDRNELQRNELINLNLHSKDFKLFHRLSLQFQ